MPNIFKRFSKVEAQPYEFPAAQSLRVEEERPAPANEEDEDEDGQPESEGERPQPALDPTKPIDYARLQAQAILQDAHNQADELLATARGQAEEEAQRLYAAAREEGRREGYSQGLAQAMEETAALRERQAEELGGQVQQFLEQAGAALDEQLSKNVDQMRDLAIAVAEKVVCISLRSSADVIARMIQVAVDKRRRREWVHIYIAECDAKRMAQLPEALSAALSALSDRVRIIPLADDESGTCIIEMPDEIIDASVSTQMNNIRLLLSDTPVGGRESAFMRRSVDRVPANDPPGL